MLLAFLTQESGIIIITWRFYKTFFPFPGPQVVKENSSQKQARLLEL